MVLLKPKRIVSKYGKKHGGGVLNTMIDNLPIELHLLNNDFKRFSFCGPGTKIEDRVTYNPDGSIRAITKPVNKLDEGCLYHDLAYTKYNDIVNRNKADEVLKKDAEKFLNSSDLSNLDKLNGHIVKSIMDFKVKNKV